MAGLVDPTVTGNYPIILGDGLLGKPSNDIFTGIRYNHKPEHSSSNAPEQARLKPAVAGKTTSYDLSYNDNGTYAFAGTRNIDSKQYVLHFDPKRKAFILDRVDSTFNMNITRTPTNTDPESLRQRHPHIKDEDLKPQSKPAAAPAPATAPAPKPKAKAKAKATGNVFQPAKASRKNEKKQVKKDVELALPKPQASPPPEPKKRKPRKDEDDEDEEEEEGPDPLEVDWGSPKDNNKADFSPAFTAVAPRRFDDYMNQRESEAEEADDDSEGPLDEELKLPSPVNSRTTGRQTERYPGSMDVDQKAQREDEDDDMDDLEKDLENAFEDLENSQNGSPDPGDESEISEED